MLLPAVDFGSVSSFLDLESTLRVFYCREEHISFSIEPINYRMEPTNSSLLITSAFLSSLLF